MSRSTADQTAQVNRARKKKRETLLGVPVWYLLSMLLHGVGFFLLVWFTPLREIVIPERQPKPDRQMRVDSERLQEMARRIEDVNLREVLQMTRQLMEMQREMRELDRKILEDYEQFAEQVKQDVLDELTENLTEVRSGHEAISEMQQEIARDLAAAREVESAVEEEATDEQRQSIEEHRSRAAATGRQAEAEQLRLENILERSANQAGLAELSEPLQEALREAYSEQNTSRLNQTAARRDAANTRTSLERAEERQRQAEEQHRHNQDKVEEVAKLLEQETVRRDQEALARAEAEAADTVAEETMVEVEPVEDTAEVVETVDDASVLDVRDREYLASIRELLDMDLPDIYEAARKIEEELTETYREIRAAELAMLRGIHLERALEHTAVPKTVRPDLNQEVLRSPARTSRQFEQRKQEVATAVRESRGMVTASRTMLEAARAVVGEEEQGFDIDLARQQADRFDLLRQAAAEDEDNVARDLAALMEHGADSRQEEGDESGEDGDQDGADGDTEGDEGGDDDDDERGDGPADTTPQPLMAPEYPPLDERRSKFTTGRRVGTAVERTADWLIVNSWYVIGPWPNPHREHMDTKFPPETVVDLDASYVGKDGRIIEWVFQQTHRPMIEPYNSEPYGIWYAYTELYFEEARNLWIAVGSDDHSRIWINDQMVWESVPWHKAWRINEGFRRVHFRQGRNRILYRIENGHHAMGWSLLVHINPEL